MANTHKPKSETWTLYFQMGGTANFTWHRASAYATHKDAQIAAAKILLGGRIALIEQTTRLDNVGLPDDAKNGGTYLECTRAHVLAAERLLKAYGEVVTV